jgi:hypothetical protein
LQRRDYGGSVMATEKRLIDANALKKKAAV